MSINKQLIKSTSKCKVNKYVVHQIQFFSYTVNSLSAVQSNHLGYFKIIYYLEIQKNPSLKFSRKQLSDIKTVSL